MQLEPECDRIDFSVVWLRYPVNIEITESLFFIEPVEVHRLQTQTSTSKGESDFCLGWDVEKIVKGAAGLTNGRYAVVLLMTRSTRPPNLREVASLTTLPKTATPRSTTSYAACIGQRGMRATIK